MTEKQVLHMHAEVQTFSEVDQFLAEVKRQSLDRDVTFSLTKKPFGSESTEITYYSVNDTKDDGDEISEETKNNIREDIAGMIGRACCWQELVEELQCYFEMDSDFYRDRKIKELELLS